MTTKAKTIKDWENARLVSVCDLNMGQSPDSKTYNSIGDGMPFFQGKSDFGFKYPNLRMYCTDPKKIVEPYDILISVRAPVGPVNFADRRSCIGRGLAGLRAKKEFLDQNFLYFNLILNEKNLASLGTGSTFHAINKSQLENFELNLPSLLEQKTIAHVLTTAKDAIAGQEELIAKLKDLKKSMIQHLFTRGTKGEKTKMTEIGEVPESWIVDKLGSLCKFEYGMSLPAKKRIDGGVPVYGSNGIVGFHNEASVNLPGIIIGRKGSAGLVHFSNTSFCPIDTTFYITNEETKQDIRFIYYLLQKIDLTKIKADVGVPGVNREMAYRELVAYPEDIKEQRKIAETIDLVQEKINLSQEKLLNYQNLFRTLLHELMSGERRVEL